MEAKREKIDGGKKMVEMQVFGTTGVNCKQLFAMIMLRFHFNMAFLGIHAVLAQSCALSGELCLRTEHLLFAEGMLIIVVVFYSLPQLKLEAQSVTWVQWIQWSV